MYKRHVWRAVIIASTLLCVVAFGGSAQQDTDLTRLLPAPAELEGWRTAEGPAEYLPETLWEYLDGAAPRYLSYGFRRLVHVRFEQTGEPSASVTLDLLDMGDKLGAFGIYRSSMPRGEPRRNWGAEGHRSGTVAAAWKCSVYVRAEADDDRPELIGTIERLVGLVCDKVAGDTLPPAILAKLPHENLVPRSERYVAEDLLGHAFLPGGVLATYEIDSHEAHLFFSDLTNESAAAEAMTRLRAHEAEWGEIVGEVGAIGAGGFRFSDPGLGQGAAVSAGRFVAGVHGDVPYDAQEQLLVRLVDNLESAAAED